MVHDAGVAPGLLDLRAAPEELRVALAERRSRGFTGVIYRPGTERWSHDVECASTDQQHASAWFDRRGRWRRWLRRADPSAGRPYPSKP